MKSTAALIAMVGWVPLCFVFFTVLSPRRAVLTCVLGGYLFLPMAVMTFQGAPDFTKETVISLGALLGALLTDRKTPHTFPLRWFDGPILVWCFWPFPSGIAMGLSPYASLSAALTQTLKWGVPYYLGRTYFRGAAARVELLAASTIAGLVYVPLCWFEIRISPQLHNLVYGYHQHIFAQTARMGGWRPMVFLQHGLAVGMMMATTGLVAMGLYWSNPRMRLLGLRISTCAVALAATTIFVKSLGAILLMGLGGVLIMATRRGKHMWALVLLAAIAPVYTGGKALGFFPTESVVAVAEDLFEEERVSSLKARLVQEDVLLAKAAQRPVMGWGPQGHFRLAEDGSDLVEATDAFWMIVVGQFGYVGLATFVSIFVFVALRGIRLAKGMERSEMIVVLTLVVVATLFLVDSLSNAMFNPLHVVFAGTLAAIGGRRIATSPGPMPIGLRRAQP